MKEHFTQLQLENERSMLLDSPGCDDEASVKASLYSRDNMLLQYTVHSPHVSADA